MATKRKATRQTSSSSRAPKRKAAGPDDPVTTYARDVVAGAIAACHLVHLACERHLRDLERQDLVWDLDAAQRAFRFFRVVLRLSGGEFEDEPFELLPWAKFVVGSLFGWKLLSGRRRFRVAYVETAKGSSKTPVAAGLGLLLTCADDEPAAEVYAAAATKEQAMIAFQDAVRMRNKSPQLRARLRTSGGAQLEWNLADLSTNSFFRPTSTDDSQSGRRVHGAIVDELHEHKSPMVVQMMRAGVKTRRQPLIFMITNAGFDQKSVCWEEHVYAKKILEEGLKNDAYFAFVCGLDEGDLPDEADPVEYLLAHEELWPKANPGLPVCPSYDYIRQQLTDAYGKPAAINSMLRLNFCLWTEAETVWLQADRWAACNFGAISPESLAGEECYGGLDMSSTTDLSAFLLYFPRRTPPAVLCWFWLPMESIARRQDPRIRGHLHEWGRSKALKLVPGNTIDYEQVQHDVLAARGQFDLREVGYDRWNVTETVGRLAAAGLEMVPVGQGFESMSAPMKAIESDVLARALNHGGHPVLAWCVSNCTVKEDPAGNVKPDKGRSTDRIDGVTALAMAKFCATRHAGDGGSVYEERLARGEPVLLTL